MSALVRGDFLNRVISARSPSHAYLFFGPHSSEKDETARTFCKSLLCKNAACGECLSCRKFESGNHPDFREIGAGEDKIKIAEIRAMKEDTRFAPLESDWKIYLIPNAERLTEEAAQSMLKILEEPPSYAVLILTASHPSAVLPTIASRCQPVPFQSKPGGVLAKLDAAESDAEAWNALISEALPILLSETRKPSELFEKGSALEDYKEDGERLLHLLLAFYRDAAVLKAGWEDGVLFPDYKERSQKLSHDLSFAEIMEKSDTILDAKEHLRHSGNFRLVMENLLWKLRGV